VLNNFFSRFNAFFKSFLFLLLSLFLKVLILFSLSHLVSPDLELFGVKGLIGLSLGRFLESHGMESLFESELNLGCGVLIIKLASTGNSHFNGVSGNFNS